MSVDHIIFLAVLLVAAVGWPWLLAVAGTQLRADQERQTCKEGT